MEGDKTVTEVYSQEHFPQTVWIQTGTLADLLNTLSQRWSKSIDLGEEVCVVLALIRTTQPSGHALDL